MAFRSRPGPLGSSCLTCKRRHKKCDLRQPVCKRCEVGRFKCEGYGHNKRGAARKDSHLPETFEDGDTSLLPVERPNDTTSSSSSGSLTSPDLNGEEVESVLPGQDNTCTVVSNQRSCVEDYLRLLISRSTSDPSADPLLTIRKIINLNAQLPSSPTDSMMTFLSYPWELANSN
ncbi:hypothetical protein RSOLAG1IB_06475 [Rhizoctonia solani AG-1 IB]|uniref:Zn(2)-C6 fungal-type domain-containing protein n=1 Tax=Thanatephorus cucumeris (strain AG1-IB / isolate 7/3/14) TaxID=1108050 RepID=A0A0B7F7W0_THACB|nr:hypothetical protein RSOLAG1IB_06475 [Rhizoctonia solani AG-1 IB]